MRLNRSGGNGRRHLSPRSDCTGSGRFIIYGDHHALTGCYLLAVRLSGPQRQFVVPGGNAGRDHDELSGLICDRLIVVFAVEQQFHRRTRGSPAGDNRLTRWLNAGNVEGGNGFIGIRRAGRCGRRGRQGVRLIQCHRERGRAFIVIAVISSAGSGRRHRRRGGCGCDFNGRLGPHVRNAQEKCCSTRRNKYQGRHDDSGYRYGSHDTRPLARSLSTLRLFAPAFKSA